MIKKILLLGMMALSAIQLLAADGVKMVANSKDLTSGKVSQSTIYINSNSMVISTSQKGTDASILFNAPKEEITFIDHSRKQYSVIDRATMKTLSQQLSQMVQMLKAFYDNMPEDQKKRLKPLVEGTPTDVDYSKLGSEMINKWTTNKYQAISGGDKIWEANIASFSSINISKSDLEALPKLLALVEKNLSGVGAIVPGAGIFSQWSGAENPMFNEGIPVKTTLYVDGQATEETIIQSIEKSSFDLADFGIPSGYSEQKIDLNNAMGQ